MPTDTIHLLEPDGRTDRLDVLTGVDDDTAQDTVVPVAACILLFAVAIFQIVIIAHTAWLTGEGSALTSADRTGYATGITVAATIVSTIAVGQIRRMWVARLVTQNSTYRLRKAQLLLQIGSLRVQTQFLWLTILLALIGLITTSIVGSTTITAQPRWYTLSYKTFQGRVLEGTGIGHEFPWRNVCWNSTSKPGAHLAWYNSTSQSYLISQTDSGWPGNFFCPSGLVSLTDQNDAALQNGYISTDQNICQNTLEGSIMCSALGSPVSWRHSCGLLATFGCQLGISNRVCLPVFTRSPVQCHEIGLASDFSSVDSDCSITAQDLNPPLLSGGGLVKACPTNNTYGEIRFIFAARQNTSLATSLNWYLLNQRESTQIAAECTLSLDTTLDHRIVVNSTISVNNASRGYDFRQLAVAATDERCTGESLDDLLDLNTRMTAAVALYYSFNSTGKGLTEFFDRGVIRASFEGGHYVSARNAWSTSKNKLEDYLGVRVAQFLGYFWGYSVGDEALVDDVLMNNVDYSVMASRIGTGSWLAILYTIPPLAASGVILWLLVTR